MSAAKRKAKPNKAAIKAKAAAAQMLDRLGGLSQNHKMTIAKAIIDQLSAIGRKAAAAPWKR